MNEEKKRRKHKLDVVASILKQPNQPKSKRWKLNIKKEYRKLGDPESNRKFFSSYLEANDWRANRKENFGSLKELSDKQIRDVQLAYDRLKDAGFSSLEEATGFSTLEKSIDFLIEEYAKQKVQSNMTISELIEKKIKYHQDRKGKRGGSAETIKDVIHRGRNKFGKQFGNMRVCDFKNKHFKPWWQTQGRSPQLLSTTKSIFGFCIENYRGDDLIIKENPITEKRDEGPKEPPCIFEPAQWRRLILAAIKTNDQEYTKGNKFELLAYVTLGLWCGIRPGAELEKMSWEDVYLDDEDPDVYVPPFRKTKYDRRVKLPPCAIELLKICKNKKGLICPPTNLKKRLMALKEIAEVSKSHGVWGSDIMRHTFASMHYAKYQSKEDIRGQLGHVVDETLSHYINFGKTHKKDAEEFWNFTPPISQCTGSGNPDLRTS